MLKTLRNVIGLIFIFLFILGCTGKVKTKNLTLNEIDQSGEEFKGVIYYLPTLFKEKSKTTVLIVDGKVIASESGLGGGECIPVEQTRLVVFADYENPKLISYDHGILEAYEFNVGINANGTLSSIKNVSAPDRGETLKNLTESAGNVAKLAAAFVGGGIPACNAGPAIIDITRYHF